MRPRVYAHRGHHLGGCAENTLEAFLEAEVIGADGFETDLRSTADDRLVLYHDDTLRGVPVDAITLADLRDGTGIRVPTLEELLDRDWRCGINLEIKTRAAWRLLEPVLGELPPHTLVTSFIHSIAVDAARRGRDAGLLTASIPLEPPFAGRGALRTWVVDARILDEDAASAWRSAGWSLATYATDGEMRHRRAYDLGASIVITDDVGLAMCLRNDVPS